MQLALVHDLVRLSVFHCPKCDQTLGIFLSYLTAPLYLIGPGSYISSEIINIDQPFERTPFKPINNFKRTPDCKRASHMLQARAQHKCTANQTFRFYTFKNCLKSAYSKICNYSMCTISIQLGMRVLNNSFLLSREFIHCTRYSFQGVNKDVRGVKATFFCSHSESILLKFICL